MREPNSLRWFSAGPLNDMLGNLEFLILNQFSYFVESHFYLIGFFGAFTNIQILKARKKGSLSAS